MRSLSLVLLAVAALLAPTAALAADGASPSANRAFVITGLVLGDHRLEASGKLSIEDGRLMASVGCNTIGGPVTLDGATVTIPEPLAMTEMACPGVNGDTEAVLLKILQSGPFTIGGGAWRGNDAAILVEELPVGPGPGGSFAPPDDGVVSSSLEPGTIEPDPSCIPVPDQINGTSPGSAGSGAGSGGGTSGSTGEGGGSTGTDNGPAATAIDLPLATAGSEPGATPVVEPDSSIPPPPQPRGTPGLGQTEPEPGVLEPGIGADPAVGKPLASDPCLEQMAAIGQPDQAAGAGSEGGVPPKASDTAAEQSGTLADATLVLPIGLGLAVVIVLAFLTVRRVRAGVAPTITGEGDPRNG